VLGRQGKVESVTSQTAHGISRNEKKHEEGREKIRNALPAADMTY
jgi:hypothetical protein